MVLAGTTQRWNQKCAALVRNLAYSFRFPVACFRVVDSTLYYQYDNLDYSCLLWAATSTWFGWLSNWRFLMAEDQPTPNSADPKWWEAPLRFFIEAIVGVI